MMKRLLLSLSLLLIGSWAWTQPQTQIGGSQPIILSVSVTCTPLGLAVGNTASCTAQLNLSNGNTQIAQGTWASNNQSIAFVSNGSGNTTCSAGGAGVCPIGQVFGVAAGTAIITFTETGGAPTNSVTVAVGQPPVIQQTGMTNCPPSGTLCTLSGSNTGYSYTFTATGGVGAYTWAMTAPSCLTGSGLTLTSGGVLSGTIPVAGTYSCTVQVTDALPESTTLAISIVITNNAGGPPNFIAYNGNQVIGVTSAPVLGTSTSITHPSTGTAWNTSLNNAATVQDTSYNTYANLPTSNLSNITRCTDPQSRIDGIDDQFAAGQGSAGAAVVVSADSKMMRIQDNTAGTGFMTAIVKTAGTYKCALPTGSLAGAGIFITADENTVSPGSSSTTVQFGNGQFDLVTAGLWWLFGPGVATTSATPTQVIPITINTTTGSFSYPNGATCGLSAGVPCPTVDFLFGLPVGNNLSECVSQRTFGTYCSHTLANLESTTPEYRLWKPNCGTSNLSACPMGAAYVLGDLVVFGDGNDGNGTNPNQCIYKLTTLGTTGATPPAAVGPNPCKIDTVTDGTAKWKGLAGQAKFVYQVTTVTGIFNFTWGAFLNQGSSTPPLHPDIGSVTSTQNSGLVVQMTNSGPNYIPLIKANLYTTGFGVSVDQHHFGASFSNNTYGGLRCTNGDCYNYAEAVQDSGFYIVEANTSDPLTSKPTYYLLNTLTGIQTNWTCTGMSPTLANCGTPTQTTWGTAAFNSIVAADGNNPGLNCPTFIHGGGQMKNGLSYHNGTAIIVKGTACPTIHDKEWQPMLAFDAWAGLQYANDGINHGFEGTNHMFDFHNCGQGGNSGVFVCDHPQGNWSGNNGGLPPGCGSNVAGVPCLSFSGATMPQFNYAPFGFSVFGNCSTAISTTNPANPAYSNGVTPLVYGYGFTLPSTVWNTTGTNDPACGLAGNYDGHMGGYNPGNDDHAIQGCGTIYNPGNANPIPNTAYQGEETCMQLTPTVGPAGYPANPVGGGNMFRFTHTFNNNNCLAFDCQFSVSSAFQDGTAIAWTSDWAAAGGLGNGATGPQATSLTGTGVPVQSPLSSELGSLPVASVPANILAFQGPVWQATFPYVLGNVICPIQGSQGGGKHFDCFQATTVNGAAGSAQPAFTNSFSPTAHIQPASGSISGTTATLTLPANSNACVATAAPQTVCIHLNQNVIVSGITPSAFNCAAPGCLVTAAGTGSVSYTIPSGSGSFNTAQGSVFAIGSTFCDNGSGSTCLGGIIWQDVGFQNMRPDVYLVTTK